MRKFTTIFLILVSHFCLGQTLNWVKTFGGAGLDSARSMVVDNQGNVYTTGPFNDTVDFDPGPGVFLQSTIARAGIFIEKLDSNGNFLWVKTIVSNGVNQSSFDIALDNQNNIVVTGYFTGTADFDPSPNTYNLTSTTTQQTFICKLDNNGNFIWAKSLNATSNLPLITAINEAKGLTIDNQDNIYITGAFYNQVDFNPDLGVNILTDSGFGDAFILKLTSNGSFVWVKQLEGLGYSRGEDVKVDNAGNVYFTGFHHETTDFDPGPNQQLIGNNGTPFEDTFLMKLDSNGNFIWVNTYNDGWGLEIQFDNFNNVYLTGFLRYSTDFDPSPNIFTVNNSGTDEVFILKLTPQNQFINVIKFDGSGGFNNNRPDDMFISNDKIYVIGTFYGTTNFGNNLQPNILTSNGQIDIFQLTTDLNLSPISCFSLGSNNDDDGWCVVYRNCSIYMCGNFQNTMDFDPQSTVFNITSNDSAPTPPYGDAYVLKLNDINTTLAPTGNTPQTFCNSATIANLIVTGVNVQWYSTATGGLPLALNTNLVNGATYYTSQNPNGCESLNRLAVSVIINTTTTPTGSSNQGFCNSATIADLTALGSNIQWYSSPSSGVPLASNTLLINGNTYYASQTVNTCESSNLLAVTTTINTIPNAPTGNTNQSFCNSATIADITVLGNNIQWYSLPIGGVILNSTTPLVNGSTYYASQTINGCESSNLLAVTISINSSPNPPTGNAIQNFCSSATILDLIAFGTNINWYLSPTSGTPLPLNTLLVNGNTYYASQTVNNCESSSFFAVTITINNVNPPSGNSNQSFCNFANISNLTAIGTNIQWYSSATGGAPLNSTLPLSNGSTYYASQIINGCVSSTRLPVNVAITISIAPTGNNNQVFCNSATIADLIANGTNIQWYLSSTGGTPISLNTPLISGITYYASQNPNGCLSTQRLPVNVSVSIPSAPTGNVNQIFCNSATIANLIANGNNIQWYSSSNGGTALSQNTILINGSTYYASQTINGCESLIRLAVNVTISNPQQPTGNNNQTFCLSDNPTVSDLQLNQTNILWYSSLTNSTPLNNNTLLVDGQTYYASQIDTSSGCESISRFAVDIIIINPPIPSGSPIQKFCIEENPTIASLTLDSNQLIWYDAPVNGNVLNNDHVLVNGEIIYAEGIDAINNCRSVSRFQVEIVIINPELEFYNLITVNNNSSNYKLTITGIEEFPINEINIFNRYGEIVWRSFNYNNTTNYFIGKTNVGGVYMQNNYLPTGTYYFVLIYKNPCKKNEIKGFFQIDNSN